MATTDTIQLTIDAAAKDEIIRLRAVNAELLEELENLYCWCVDETKDGGHLGPGHEWPNARRVIAKHRS